MTSEKKTQYFCFAVVVLHVSVDRKKLSRNIPGFKGRQLVRFLERTKRFLNILYKLQKYP